MTGRPIPPEERKPVTILFADVVGSTSLAERMDPEDWRELINAAFERLSPAIHRYDGTVAQLLGDGMLVFFGAPVAHEDDPARAVRAALDLLAASREFGAEVAASHGIDFEIRVGVNTGLVVVGAVGSGLRQEYLAVGDAVNIAARLQAAASPMTVLISEVTHRFVAPLFECLPLDPIVLKGKSQPVRTYEVRGPRAAVGPTRGLAGLESPMVGRDGELDRLLGMAEAAASGSGAVAAIVGEPGLGKSRLLAELRDRAAKHPTASTLRWAFAHCLSYGRSLAHHALVELLRDLLAVEPWRGQGDVRATLGERLARLPGEVRPGAEIHLAHLLGLPLEPEERRRIESIDPDELRGRQVDAVRHLVAGMSAERPLVLVVEDVHWADSSSAEVLLEILPMCRERPVLWLFAGRPEPEAPGWQLCREGVKAAGDRGVTVTLESLGAEDAGRLAANLIGSEQDRLQPLLARAEGNPFFLEELIRMLVDRGSLSREGDRWVVREEVDPAEIPATLQGLLLARIDGLPEDRKRTLKVASVVGRQFAVRVLEEVLG